MESAAGIHFRRGKQRVSRLFSRWNSSVYSSVLASRNPDFDLGVDFVDTLKMQFHCIFRDKIISYVIKICFFQILPNKISIVLILNSKSCICCRKHCIAYFRRHMECAVLKRFLKVQGTFLKKFLQITLFHLEKIKFNPFY